MKTMNLDTLRSDICDIFNDFGSKSFIQLLDMFRLVLEKNGVKKYKKEGNGYVHTSEYIFAESFFKDHYNNQVGLQLLCIDSPNDFE